MRSTFSQRYILTGIVLSLIACAIWVMFLKDYMRVGTDDDPQWPASGTDSDLNATEFQYFSRRGLVPAEDSRIIAEQNIFSSTRKEWTPPQPKKESTVPEVSPGSAERGRPDIELRGVSFVAGKPWAILRFMSFKPEETQVLKEDDFVSVPGGAGNAYLLVAEIGSDFVVIEDQDGVEYKIGLHEHRRTIVPSAPAEPRIFMHSPGATPESRGVVPPAKAPAKPPVPGQTKNAAPKNIQQNNAAGNVGQ